MTKQMVRIATYTQNHEVMYWDLDSTGTLTVTTGSHLNNGNYLSRSSTPYGKEEQAYLLGVCLYALASPHQGGIESRICLTGQNTSTVSLTVIVVGHLGNRRLYTTKMPGYYEPTLLCPVQKWIEILKDAAAIDLSTLKPIASKYDLIVEDGP